MTGYTRIWDCYLCGEPQETVHYPRVFVCHPCVIPLASSLCRETLGVDLTAEGVDRDHWERRAWDYAEVLFRRSKRLKSNVSPQGGL